MKAMKKIINQFDIHTDLVAIGQVTHSMWVYIRDELFSEVDGISNHIWFEIQEKIK